MKNKTMRLRFSKEELENESVFRAAKRAERAADKADEVKARLPVRNKLQSEKKRVSGYRDKLRFGKQDISVELETRPRGEKKAGKSGTSKGNSRVWLDKNVSDIKVPGSRAGYTVQNAATGIAAAQIHQKMEENEDDNVGIQVAHQSEKFVAGSAQMVNDVRYSHKLKPYQKAARLERKADKANVDALFKQALAENPETGSNPFSRWKQRQEIKKQYYAAKAAYGSAAGSTASGGAAKGTEKTAKMAGTALGRFKEFAVQQSHVVLLIFIFALLFVMISGAFSSCSVMMQGSTGSMLAASFTASDEDILGANADYKALEAVLQSEINNMETAHPDYDEYRYQLEEINHNPYELTAYLTVLFEDYTREEVQDTLQELFDRQYELKLEEEIEIRTRTETRTHTVIDPETGEVSEEAYEVEVEYNYYILNVILQNRGLGPVITMAGLTEEQNERYNVLLQTQGNRPYLFEDDIYANSTGEYTDYDIPGEALTDERFANMIQEAEKYLGYPYIWGGSSPSTSFDCSGFVSWVINNCGNGWNIGRQTANGLMSACDIIPASEAQPGDLIFFQGTYDVTGASHVGIYVGNGMMLHCGNPISYASVETSYWQAHFYCYGRIR